MIEWGGNQHGILGRFQRRLGTYNLDASLGDVVNSLNHTERAITAGLAIPGLGLTYASKLLRFLSPETYGALDSRIRTSLIPNVLPKLHDGYRPSLIRGYGAYIRYLTRLQEALQEQKIICPLEAGNLRPWRIADIEMALFGWASAQSPRVSEC
jgi:hypothetical protein